jgi:hypothetical protein
VLLLRGREYPVAWNGTAWTEPETGRVVRIHAEAAGAIVEVGLEMLEAETIYGPVTFQGESAQYWLPQTAVVQARTALQQWRNLHRFTQFKRFEVTTTVTDGAIQR